MSSACLLASSFLLFCLQPMLAKALLPEFGGGAAVWTLCLLGFQTLLLAGYAYAHLSRPALHVLCVVASLAFLPVRLQPHPGGDPSLGLLRSLIPAAPLFLLLAATSPLLQRWSSSKTPYRLYALSNAGSLLALLAYPFAIELWLPLKTQFHAWSAAYGAFALLTIAASLRASSGPNPANAVPPVRDLATWMLLSGCGSGILMGTTNQMCQEIAPVPFLWVAPLALYLLTFILVFERGGWYRRRLTAQLAGVAVPCAAILVALGLNVPVLWHLVGYAAALFFTCLLVHGELALAKPESNLLTWFYLAIAAGGAAGGGFVALAAPRLFSSFSEYPLLLSLACLLGLVLAWRAGEFTGLWRLAAPARAALAALIAGTLAPLTVVDTRPAGTIAQSRNFYGVLRVSTSQDQAGPRRILTHGQTMHGSQFTSESRRAIPTAYYGFASAPGLFLDTHPRGQGGLRIGLIGLGAGTLARYARTTDVLRVYEINPAVVEFARTYFWYLSGSAGKIEMVEGDARVRLRDEPPQRFDALVVDAFSSDSIPAHLLTIEAADVYRRHLAPEGKIFFHVSNRTLDLDPVVKGLARHLGYSAFRLDSPADPDQAVHAATWITVEPGGRPVRGKVVRWTDDFTSLWSILK